MNNELDKALKNWDYYELAKLTMGEEGECHDESNQNRDCVLDCTVILGRSSRRSISICTYDPTKKDGRV